MHAGPLPASLFSQSKASCPRTQARVKGMAIAVQVPLECTQKVTSEGSPFGKLDEGDAAVAGRFRGTEMAVGESVL